MNGLLASDRLSMQFHPWWSHGSLRSEPELSEFDFPVTGPDAMHAKLTQTKPLLFQNLAVFGDLDLNNLAVFCFSS